MARAGEHLSDDELDAVDGSAEGDGSRLASHLGTCLDCRRRRAALVQLRQLLAQTGNGERQPARNVVPSAMKRLRLRRHSVTNANEFFEGLAAFVRGLASLFSVAVRDEPGAGRKRGAEDERRG